MKLSAAARLLALPLVAAPARAQANCGLAPLEIHESIGVQAVKVGAVPASSTALRSYNMMPADSFDDALYFMDQGTGKIYAYNEADHSVTKVFDIETSEVPAGVDFDWAYLGAPNAFTFKVQSMTQGNSADEVYVVLQSQTLPDDWDAPDAPMPAPGAFAGHLCNGTDFYEDIYRMGRNPSCLAQFYIDGAPTPVTYVVFVKYALEAGTGQLVAPEPFFVGQTQVTHGHMGGGIATVDGGKVLWATGDALLFGTDGRWAPQLDDQTQGKILLIDPAVKGKYNIVAKGVRNSQQFRVVNTRDWNPSHPKNIDFLVFMDIGGATAEEVNVLPLKKIMNTKHIDNFGWGRSIADGKAREGTFYVQPGYLGFLGQPMCQAEAPSPEEGFIQPWIQFGRDPNEVFHGIISFAISYESFDKLEMLWAEFNTGKVMGTTSKWWGGAVQESFYLKLYDEQMNELPKGFNDLTVAELGSDATAGWGGERGDPRLFHFPDGSAGLLVERTGAIYKITEVVRPDVPQ